MTQEKREMKETGVEWLGEIPSHWDVKRLKFCATIRTTHIDPKLEEFSQRKLIAPNHIESSTGRLLEVDSAEEQGAISAKVPFQQGDVLYSKIRPNLHKVCIAPFDGLCSSDIYPLLPNGNIISSYFLYTILCKGFHQLTVLQVMGATIPRINQESLMDILIPLPPLNEQRAIAAYLDAETARIDKLITKTKRLNELLREKRTALISEAVTKGLDAGLAMKASGVEWLGEIPRHWDVKRLKFLTRKPLMYGANEAADDNRRDYPRYIRITDIKEDGGLRDDTFRSLPYETATPYLLTEGDILFARSGATVGKTFRYQADWGIACFAGYLIRFRCDPTQVISEFVDYFTSSKPYWEWVNGIFIKATIQNISAEKYANTSLGVPPLHEQRAIAAYLDAETARIDRLIGKNDRLIDLLREKRSALISAAVTGKIAVPAVEPGTSC